MSGRHWRRLKRRLSIPAIAALFLAAGCSAGSAASAATRWNAATDTLAGQSSSVPPALIVAKLLPSATLRGAGFRTATVEDDGGAPGSGAFVTSARVGTSAGTFSIALATYPTKGEASTVFQQFAQSQSGSRQPLASAGDKAVSVGTMTYVLKGAQVLTIQGQMSSQSSSSLEQAKANGTLNQSAIDAANVAVVNVERSLAVATASKMSGQRAPNGSSVTYVPSNGINPCTVAASSLNNRDIRVTSQPIPSDSPPALECVYTFTGSRNAEPGTGQLAFYTLTQAQAAAAVPSTSVSAAFSGVSQGSSPGGQGFSMASASPFAAEGTTAGEPNYALANLGSPPKSQVIIRIQDQASSYVVDRFHCYDEIVKMFNEMLHEANAAGHSVFGLAGPAAADAARAQMEKDIADWCTKEAMPTANAASG